MVRSAELAADSGPSGSSSLVASVPPSVAPRIRARGGVSGGLIDAGEASPPVLWWRASLCQQQFPPGPQVFCTMHTLHVLLFHPCFAWSLGSVARNTRQAGVLSVTWSRD
jgi:hypothetical protein